MADTSATGGVVKRFYDAFEAGDADTMQACYAPDATFRDEVFTLTGRDEIGSMWRMLVERGGDLDIKVSGISEDASSGRAHWVATYTFSATGRPVVNVIDATFEISGGLIASHVDRFNFWTWSRQALGPTGLLLGWTPIVRGKVQTMATAQLEKFRASSA